MARAYTSPMPQDYGPDPKGDWQALRGELTSLLEQVESQVARTRREEPGYQGIAERMRDLRDQLSDAEPDLRHREALRSVKRAVDRFSDRDDGAGGRAEGYPPNPRDTLQSAIQQIRARQGGFQDPAPQRQRRAEPPQFDHLAHAVGGISGRLERLENELRGAAKVQTGNVKEIAEQVAQLSHVVELLAGAVGETGQVKRLESQIAGLANLMADGSRVDLGALTKRLDDVGSNITNLMQRQRDEGVGLRLDDISATMGRLADLQVQFADRVGSGGTDPGLLKEMRAAGDAVKEEVGSIGLGLQRGMGAIEEAVRNVYDRIDAIERHTALSPADLERLTDEMAHFTEAMKNPQQVETILELVESIHQRIGQIESPHSAVGDLKLDLDALRATVVEAVEPRFAALEMQIEALTDRVGGGGAGGDISVSHLEAQVRQLVARMDQTGEQLTGLARLYTAPTGRDAPDYDALADLVASRTSEAVAQFAPSAAGGAPALSDSGIEEIERRISRLLEAANRDGAREDFSVIEGSIREVSDRIGRIEQALAARSAAPEPAQAAPAVPAATEPTAYVAGNDPLAPLLAEAISDMPDATVATPSTPRDAMPRSPSEDAPLRDRPFADSTGPIRAALEAKNGPRKLHPGLNYEPPPGQGGDEAPASDTPKLATADRPAFDPEQIERPPRPVSSFDAPAQSAFDEPAPPAPGTADDVPANHTPSTNTFIAAARRAAQRQQQQPERSSGSGSLIARALATFQQAREDAATTPEGEKPKAEKKKGRMARLLAGDKEPRSKWTPESGEPSAREPVVGPTAPEPVALDHEVPPAMAEASAKESFLSRHRRPILLAVALAAVALLTLNLVQQRLTPSDGEGTTPAAETPGDVSSLDSGAMVPPLTGDTVAAIPAAGPRVIPIVDSLATASIDPAAADGFTPAEDLPEMPMAFTPVAGDLPEGEAPPVEVASLVPLAETVAPLETGLESPVTVGMPPEGLGPEPLRRAAAEGDARAQFEVAAIYTEGRAVPEDLAAAAVWYERAAAQGFAPAQYRLGNLYENGRGVAKDLQQARLWYQRAAEAGNRMAMHNLAALYAGGDLGKQEFQSAAEWFEQAAIRGMRDSQFNLGMLHARGLGVPQDLAESYRWFSLAANRGDADAAKARDDVARSLDAETVSRLDDEIETFVIATIDLGANFAPIGTWAETFDPGEPITNIDVIKSVQAALGALGYDVGVPDGVAGPRTSQAIKAFETATGMPASGAVNPRLLAVLGSQPV